MYRSLLWHPPFSFKCVTRHLSYVSRSAIHCHISSHCCPDSGMKTYQIDDASVCTSTARFGAADYFQIARHQDTHLRHLPSSPLATNVPPLSASNSSRGSWSSLFNAGSMRQFMTGVQDTLKDGLYTPSDASHGILVIDGDQIPVLKPNHDSPQQADPSMIGMSKAWTGVPPLSSTKTIASFLSADHGPRLPQPTSRIVKRQITVHGGERFVTSLSQVPGSSFTFNTTGLLELSNHIFASSFCVIF